MKTSHAKKCNRWHTVTRHGATVLRSPDGTDYAGTPAEIRAARLFPSRRRSLAESIRLFRYVHTQGTIDRDHMLAVIAEERRRAIKSNYFDHKPNEYATISEDLYVDIEAAARATGMTATEYQRKALADAIERTRRACGGELPYTRYEAQAIGKAFAA